MSIYFVNQNLKYYKNAYVQPTNPTGITATSGWENPKNAFDNNSSTYARCNSLTDYIEWDIGEEINLIGVNSSGIQVDSQAVATGIIIKKVDSNGKETELMRNDPSAGRGSYTTSGTCNPTLVSKLRFYITTTYSGAPSRTIQINLVTAPKESTSSDYDYISYEDCKIRDVYLGIGKTNCLTHIPQDIKLDFSPLNVTVTGTPAITNGVVSGFSNSNYLTIGKTFSPGSKSWEVEFQFSPSGGNTGNTVLFDASNNTSTRAITMYLSSALKMCVGLASSTSSSNIKNEGAGSFTFVAGKVYKYKLSFSGSVYKGEVYDAEKGTWTTDFTQNSTTPVYSSNLLMIGQWQGKTAPFNGGIDLSQSYIKINGSTWWKGGTGTLTLKTGSKVYKPNGNNVFQEFTTTKDVVLQDSPVTETSQRIVFISTNNGGAFEYRYLLKDCYSGSTAPTGVDTNAVWYDTANNIIKRTINGGTTWTTSNTCFPICLFTRQNGVGVTSVDKVFNGFGFIGSTIYGLPRVKGLIANGYNNGIYNVIEFTIPKVITYTITSTGTTRANNPFFLANSQSGYDYFWDTTNNGYSVRNTEPDASLTYQSWYNPDVNYMYHRAEKGSSAVIDSKAHAGYFNVSDSKIIDITINPVKTNGETRRIKDIYFCPGKTNCLTHIPNDIKLELNNGTLTVKAGSKVYVPNGYTSYKYYKYTYENWTQPIATGQTTAIDGGNMVITATNQYSSAAPWLAMDGTTNNLWVMNETAAGYWQLKLPYKIIVTGLTFYNISGRNKTNVARFYTDSSLSTPIGDQFSAVNSDFGQTVVSGIPAEGIETDTIYLKTSSAYGTSSGMSELKITAKRRTGSVESTSSDYDYKVGSGSMIFDEVVISSDISRAISGSSAYNGMVLYNLTQNRLGYDGVSVCTSGTTPPEKGFFYNTNDNTIKYYTNNVAGTDLCSLPVCLSYIDGRAGFTSIDQVFNGFGYIGSTAFALPGVKGLVANGFNADGTYKNSVEWINDRVKITEKLYGDANAFSVRNNGFVTNKYFGEYTTAPNPSGSHGMYYNTKENQIYINGTANWNINSCIVLGSLTQADGKITSLTPNPVQTTNNLRKISIDV